jgi:hypothetical protein
LVLFFLFGDHPMSVITIAGSSKGPPEAGT